MERTPPEPLSRAAILERALALVDAEGRDAVGIRRLARELGVTPMALYWHFESKQALLYALGDRLLADVDLAMDGAAAWPVRLRAVVWSLTAVLRAHPFAAPLIEDLPTVASENALQATEALLDILRSGGFTPDEAVQIGEQIVRVTSAMVVAGGPAKSPEHEAHKRELLLALPAERFPRVREAAEPLSTAEDDEAFYELGVELLVGGIEAAARRRAR